MTSLEKNEMKYQILHLQGEVNALKFLNDKQSKKIEELEYENEKLRGGAPSDKQLSIDDVEIPQIDLEVIKESRFQLTKTMKEVIQLLKTPSVTSANYLDLPDPNESVANPVDELLAKDNFVFHTQENNHHQPLPTNKIKAFKEPRPEPEPLSKDKEPIYELKHGQLVEQNGANGQKDNQSVDIFTDILNDRKKSNLDYFDKRELMEIANSESQTARDINNFINSQSEISKSPPLLPHEESDADTIALETDEDDANEEILEKIGNLKPNDFPGSPTSKFKRLSPSTSASLFINDDLILNDNKTTPSPSPSPPLSELNSNTNPTSNELSPVPTIQLQPITLDNDNYKLFSNSHSNALVIVYFDPSTNSSTSLEVIGLNQELKLPLTIFKDFSKIVDIFILGTDQELQEYKFIVVLEDTIEFVKSTKGVVSQKVLINATAINSGKVNALDLISIESKNKKDQSWGLVVSSVNTSNTKIKVFEILCNTDCTMESLSQFTSTDSLFLKWYKNDNARRVRGSKGHKRTTSVDDVMLPYEVIFKQDNKVFGWNIILKKKTPIFDVDAKSELLLQDNIVLYTSGEGVNLYNLQTEEKQQVKATGGLNNWAILTHGNGTIVRFADQLVVVFDTKLQLLRTEKVENDLNLATAVTSTRSQACITSGKSHLLLYPMKT